MTALHEVAYSPVLDILRDQQHRSARAAPDLAAWLAWLELEGKADRTRDGYERDVAKLLRTFPDKTLGEFTDGDLVHLVRGWPEGSRRIRAASINAFFGWAYRTRRIPQNPMDFVPKQKKPHQQVFDVFEPTEIAALEGLTSPDGQLMAVLFGTGLRKSEARHLRRRDILLDRGDLIVRQGKGAKDRVVPLTERAQTAVAELDLWERLNPDDYLWATRPGGASVICRSKPVVDSSFHRWWKRCVTTAGVKYRKPHMTRHTYATWLKEGLGMTLEDVQDLLGHASIETTKSIYVHTKATDIGRRLREAEART